MENYTEVSLIEVMLNNGYKLKDKVMFIDIINYLFINDYETIEVKTLFGKIHMVGSYSRSNEPLLIECNILKEIIAINDKENA